MISSRALRRCLAVVLAVTAIAGAAPAAVAGTRSSPRTPQAAGDVVPGRYIVTVRSDANPAKVAGAHRRAGGARLRATYTAASHGFAIQASPAALARLRADRRVLEVEPDRIVHATGAQVGATWGLDRIDQTDLPLDGTYHYDRDGEGVTAYIVDSGIRAHSDFAGRVAAGYTSISDGKGTDDCSGHGTHVAGTVAGSSYGVAKRVTLVPVRVLDCSGSGTTSGVIAGLDWVTRQVQRHGRPAVANLSLGGPAHNAMDKAVRQAVAAGVTVVVAAGNDNTDACSQSPAREPAAITVGASTSKDARASFSNYGTCVDLFAPGQYIKSASNASSTTTRTMSGTSMASPHAAGVAALHVGSVPSATPGTVASTLVAGAAADKLAGVGTGSPNLLLQIGSSAGMPAGGPAPVAAPAQPPTVQASAWCARNNCTFDATASSAIGTTISSVEWVISDGTTAQGVQASTAFTEPGTHNASVTATDAEGRQTTAKVTVSCRAQRRARTGVLFCS